ncbi:hypothetical protein BCR32DRAFT_292385 [Anaeromyces robustus]|uniref:Programmed cell death protein 2 C-terminal domain-containing protein n=1 Tax=Anaeromyces robustus TaxID=1754192 RepID=A0A1Y1XBN1_9FUNG|nr:hypothetical protein BCR32DRAFT_292385 [Anaeromyces robustus]|eukprot:ORX82826.1 hypothetical protein BCR32DRAFT_292385 [Anaeromyces robustus]
MSDLINSKPELYLGWAYDRVEEQDRNNPYIDKIGGKPIWFNQNCPPPTTYATCDNCGERLFLLMQLQGHITKRKYDRIFYVWGCNNSQCMGKKGSFKVLRAHKGTHFKNHTKFNNKSINKKVEIIPTNQELQSEIKNDVNINTPVTSSQSSINSEKNTPLKSNIDIDMNPIIIDPKEYEKEINEIKEMNNNSNDNDLEFGFGDTQDFSWDTPTFGDASNDNWGTFGDNDFGSFGDSNVNNNNNNTNDDMDDLNKLLALRNKKYEENEEEEEEPNNNVNNKKENQKIEETKETKENIKDNKVNQEVNEEVKEEQKEELSDEIKKDIEKINEYWNKSRFFPDYYLDMDLDQPNAEKDDYSHEKKLIEEYEKQNKLKGNDSSEINWGDEKYEKTDNKYYNKVFRKFNEVVQEEPEQCLRYYLKGEPLFYDNDEISKKYSNPKNIPRCEKCGALRTFEFQLMPNILSVLPTEKFLNKRKPHKNIHKIKDINKISRSDLINQFDTGMEWGTVLVFTCSKDCDMDEIKKKNSNEGEEKEDDGMWREDVSYYEELAVIEMESLF